MRSGVGYWMMSRPCPPIEDTTVFSANWRSSSTMPALSARAASWVLMVFRGGADDPMGSTLTTCGQDADFEVLARLI